MTGKGKTSVKKSVGEKPEPSRRQRAEKQAESLTRQMVPARAVRKTKLPILATSEATLTDPYVPLLASGIVLMPGSARPVFLLKHEESGDTLPVWMHPLDASIGIHELGQGASGSPHLVTKILLEQLGVTHVNCFFTERIGHHQYVRLEFQGTKGTKGATPDAIRVRADEVMSFCIATKARFFSTKTFIAQCRVLNEELEKLQEGLLAGTAHQAFPELEIDSKKSGYMM